MPRKNGPAVRYGSAHKARRAMMIPNAIGQNCPRCNLPMGADEPLDLDHGDDPGGPYLGVTHAACNRRAGQAIGAQRQRDRWEAERSGRRKAYTASAMAVSGAVDRHHTAIGIAARTADGPHVVLELVWAPRGELIAEIAAELGLGEVTLDPCATPPHPAPPFLGVLRPTRADARAALEALRAALVAGEVRHVPHSMLTAAVRAADASPAGIWVPGLSRVDMSPLRAVALAYATLV